MLHIINQPSELNSCLRLAAATDDILLIENGVLAAIANTASAELISHASRQFFVLKPDSEARGLTSKILSTVTLIDYEGFVDLTLRHKTIQSW